MLCTLDPQNANNVCFLHKSPLTCFLRERSRIIITGDEAKVNVTFLFIQRYLDPKGFEPNRNKRKMDERNQPVYLSMSKDIPYLEVNNVIAILLFIRNINL